MFKIILLLSLVLGFSSCSKTKDVVTKTGQAVVKASQDVAAKVEKKVIGEAPSFPSGSVDTASSVLKWTGKKLGSSHYGTLKLKSANLKLEGDKVIGGVLTIDMNSMTVDDIDDSQGRGKLLGHLKNDDFFGTDKHPTAKFVLSSLDGNKGYGKLTIKGVTKENLEFTHKLVGNNLKGSLNFNRTDYGIKYGSKSFFSDLGDKFIEDMVMVDFDIVLK